MTHHVVENDKKRSMAKESMIMTQPQAHTISWFSNEAQLDLPTTASKTVMAL
jgi:hypothetical protein